MKLRKNPPQLFPDSFEEALIQKGLKTFLAVALLGDSKNILKGLF